MAVVSTEGQLATVERVWSPGQTWGSWGGMSGAVSLYANFWATYSYIYRVQHNVRLVVDFLARNVAQLGLQVFRRASDTDRERLSDHALARRLDKPNPHTTRFRMLRATVADLCIFGNAFWIKIRAARPRPDGPDALVRLLPDMVDVLGTNWLYPEGYRIRGNNGRIEVDASQVVHFRYHHPSDSRVGLSPLETLRRILAEEESAGRYREQFWLNSARISGVIERPPNSKWSEDARKRFKEDWRQRYTSAGPDAGGTPILEDGMQWKEAAFSARDAQYLEARKLTREEVAAAFFIPPPMVGILDHATFSNITEQHQMLYQDTLAPECVMMEEEIDLQLLPDYADSTDVYTEFNLAEKLKGSFEQQAAVMQTLVGGPVMTRNEGRGRLNLPAIDQPEADELIVPLNVILGGQASPTDTAPPPKPPGTGKSTDEVVRRFIEHQRAAIASRAGARGLKGIYDADHWERRLTAELAAANGHTGG